MSEYNDENIFLLKQFLLFLSIERKTDKCDTYLSNIVLNYPLIFVFLNDFDV
jgi:hypothetical protein